MSVDNYAELVAHVGHDIDVVTYSGENAAVECNDCALVLVDFDRELES